MAFHLTLKDHRPLADRCVDKCLEKPALQHYEFRGCVMWERQFSSSVKSGTLATKNQLEHVLIGVDHGRTKQ